MHLWFFFSSEKYLFEEPHWFGIEVLCVSHSEVEWLSFPESEFKFTQNAYYMFQNVCHMFPGRRV